jgi:uncharacterized protein YbjT (DUF2867 family)
MNLVFGATGNIGSAVVDALVRRGVPVRGVSSRTREGHTGVEMAVGNLDDVDSLVPLLDGVSSMFVLAGYAGSDELMGRAASEGVERIVLLSSSSTTGPDDNPVARFNFASESAATASGIAPTIIRPNSFMTNAFRWNEQLSRGDTITEAFPDVPVSTIDPADVGEIASIAMTEAGHAGKIYRATGPESLRPIDRVAILGDVLGRRLTFVGQSDEDARAAMLKTMPNDMVQAFFGFFAEGKVDETTVLPTVREVTGHSASRFAEWAFANASQFPAGPV